MIYLRTGVGIEIRGEDLLISVLRSNVSAGVFTQFRRIPGFRQRDREEVRREIDSFFKTQRISRDNIALGVPRKDLVVRHLELPGEVADNLKQVVQYQAQSYEPSEEDKFYFDFALLKAGQGNKKLQVMLVMIRRSLLDSYLDVLRELGIRPAVVTGGSVALANMFFQTRKQLDHGTMILVDLSPAELEVVVLRDRSILCTSQVEKEEGAGWKEILLRELEAATGKVRMGPDDELERVVLAGEAAETAEQELREIAEGCELVGRSIHFEMPPQNRLHLQEAATSLGLAYSSLARRHPIRLNLLPPSLRMQQTRWAYIPSIVLALAIVAFLGALGFRQIVQEQKLIRQLEQEMQALRGRVDSIRTLQTQAEALRKRVEYLEGLLRQRDMNLEALQELTNVLPADTYLQMYANREGSISISGSSSSVSDLIPKLENSLLFKNVQQRGTIYKDAQTGKDRFNFEMKLEK